MLIPRMIVIASLRDAIRRQRSCPCRVGCGAGRHGGFRLQFQGRLDLRRVEPLLGDL